MESGSTPKHNLNYFNSIKIELRNFKKRSKDLPKKTENLKWTKKLIN